MRPEVWRAHADARAPGRAVGCDMLTGLLQRTAFFDRLGPWRAAPGAAAALVLIDIDQFKSINDRFGHVAGDALLAAVGRLLQDWTAPGDLAARLGGDEFVLALRRPDRQTLLDDLERLRASAAALAVDAAPGVPLGLSLGLAWPAPDESAAAAITRADAAMVAAKAQGRGRLVEDTAGMPDEDPYEAELQRFLDLTRVYADRLTQMVELRGRRLLDGARRDAFQDRLTGAHNRRYFDQRLAREWAQAQRHGLPLALIFLDLDNFGLVNRQHGWPAGDAVLRQAADAMRGAIRLTDWLARWGGEEFCVVLPATGLDEAADIAERLLAAVAAAPMVLPDGTPLRVTGSLGVAAADGLECEARLIDRAGAAARQAKSAGKNRVVVARG